MTPSDLQSLSTEDLSAKLKQAKKNEIYAAFAVGMLIGIMVFAIARKGFGWVSLGIPLFMMSAVVRQSSLKKKERMALQEELARRTANVQ